MPVVSRGPGATERVILREVRALAGQGEPATRQRVLAAVLGPRGDQPEADVPPDRASSLYRAVRSLQRKGLLGQAQWTNVLELTASGQRALDALGGGPRRAELDLLEVRRAKPAASPRGGWELGRRAGRQPGAAASAPTGRRPPDRTP
jgi:hypothetical protein